MSRRNVHNFEDTYAGISDEEEDAFNDETFGTAAPVGLDFSFGSAPPPQQQVNYAEAARTKPVFQEDQLKPMESLWSSEPVSVEQLEAQVAPPLEQVPHGQELQQQQQQQFPQMFPPGMGYNFYPPGFMPPQGYPQFIPPQGFQVPPPLEQLMIQGQFPQGQFPQGQFPQGQLPQGQFPQSQVLQGQSHSQGRFQDIPQAPQGPQPPVPQPSVQQAVEQAPIEQFQSPAHAPLQQQPLQQQQQQQPKPRDIKQDLSDFPVLGTNGARHNREQLPPQHREFQQRNQRDNQPQRDQNNRHRQYNQHYDNFNELPEEEKQRIMKRQHKVQRILQYCGIMTPRDKDFISRIQLSQIVTDDPYVDDFYYQVHRLLKTGQAEVDNNNVAQSYLDLSGHRLGGRHQRADVALQRMQQQVQKAVTYAKDRAKMQPSAAGKGGALGKTSFLGKTPRKQLEITLKSDAVPEVTKSGRKSILLQIENIYQKVLELESAQRDNKELNTEQLWDTLKLFEESDNMNFFIQILSYEKGLKIFPRVYSFLDRQQKLTIITLIFANLSLIKIITKSSFKNYENEEIPADVQKTIELFQHVVLKTIMVFLSYETVITEIIGLMTILIERNNVAFLGTSKLGTSLITILLSRAEIIKQEQNISAEDIQDWAEAYDKLFSALETKLSLLFPASKVKYDDSYIWQFFASLALSGKLNHQRIIVDEIRDQIFGSVTRAQDTDDAAKAHIISNLNLFLNVIGLNANGEEIVELK